MRKNNGFVFMETIVVLCVLSATLVTLFYSYKTLIRKAKERNTYDTTEIIYKTYYVDKFLNNLASSASSTNSGIKYYISKNECSKVTNSYICDLTKSTYNGVLVNLKKVYNVQKIYYIDINDLKTLSEDWLLKFDATTVDYLKTLDSYSYTKTGVLVVKYLKSLESDSYVDEEILFGSMEVNY